MEEETAPLVPAMFDGPADDLPDFDQPAAPSPGSVGSPHDVASLEAVLDVPVRVQAVLGGARVEVGELVRMHAGSVIELDRRVGEPVDILVNERLIARGELVLIDGALGVTLTEIVKPQ